MPAVGPSRLLLLLLLLPLLRPAAGGAPGAIGSGPNGEFVVSIVSPNKGASYCFWLLRQPHES